MTQELKIVDIGWIEKIPNDWNLKKVKEVYKFVSVKVSDSDYPALTVSSKYGITPQMEHVAKTLNGDARKRVEKGDFVINSRADRPGACGISAYDGSVSMICHVLKPRNEELLQEEYMHYLFRNNAFSQEFYRRGRGIVSDLWSTRKDEFGNLQVPIPPIKIQKRIGEYLKYKEQALNSLIELKVEQLEKLEQQRQSIITEAVTKGLNPNVKMKNSGVEWIGEVPEHWETKKVKYLIQEKLSYGANEAAELDDENSPRYIRITDIDELGNLKKETFKSLPLEIAKNYVVKTGDILLARSGGTVGKSYIHKEDKEASYAGYLIKLRAQTLTLAEYIYYFTNSSLYEQWINSILIQATIQNVSAEKYANLTIPIPNNENEMKNIVSHIKIKERELLTAVDSLKEQIKKLKEYRQSLIYEAVTGKIDVSDMEID